MMFRHIKAYNLNKKITSNNKQGVIPVIIDSEISTLNQYLEPVLEELVKIPGQNFDFYFGEMEKGTGKAYFCYNPKNAFPANIYSKLKGKMLFLSAHIYPKGPSSALKIIIDHGICSVKFTHHPKEFYKNYDIYCVTGKLNKNKIAGILEKFDLQDDITLLEIGYPKSDKLYNGLLTLRDEIFKKLNLDPSKKTVIYAPSWEKGLSMGEYGYEVSEIICQNKNLNLIIKPHPGHLTDNKFYNLGTNWVEKFKPLVLANSNCVFIEEFEIAELLAVSDIMITDISSVALEFLALEKPVVYFDCPKFEQTFKTLYAEFNDISYSELLSNPMCNAGRHVGLVNYNYKTILDDIKYLIDNPEYKLKERKEYSALLLSNKGQASKICAENIISQFEIYNSR